jgi:uncharacterized protein (DUF433 family)
MALTTRTPPESTSIHLFPGSEIRKTPGVCGGSACIRHTRIPVWLLVEARQMGLPDEEILDRIEGLTKADLAAAWEYSATHGEEIEEALRLADEDM